MHFLKSTKIICMNKVKHTNYELFCWIRLGNIFLYLSNLCVYLKELSKVQVNSDIIC